MTVKTIVECDRCGKREELEEGTRPSVITLLGLQDLCKKCKQDYGHKEQSLKSELKDWLAGGV